MSVIELSDDRVAYARGDEAFVARLDGVGLVNICGKELTAWASGKDRQAEGVCRGRFDGETGEDFFNLIAAMSLFGGEKKNARAYTKAIVTAFMEELLSRRERGQSAGLAWKDGVIELDTGKRVGFERLAARAPDGYLLATGGSGEWKNADRLRGQFLAPVAIEEARETSFIRAGVRQLEMAKDGGALRDPRLSHMANRGKPIYEIEWLRPGRAFSFGGAPFPASAFEGPLLRFGEALAADASVKASMIRCSPEAARELEEILAQSAAPLSLEAARELARRLEIETGLKRFKAVPAKEQGEDEDDEDFPPESAEALEFEEFEAGSKSESEGRKSAPIAGEGAPSANGGALSPREAGALKYVCRAMEGGDSRAELACVDPRFALDWAMANASRGARVELSNGLALFGGPASERAPAGSDPAFEAELESRLAGARLALAAASGQAWEEPGLGPQVKRRLGARP